MSAILGFMIMLLSGLRRSPHLLVTQALSPSTAITHPAASGLGGSYQVMADAAGGSAPASSVSTKNSSPDNSARKSSSSSLPPLASMRKLLELEYRVYPRRSREEAAVIEWGHSAIISALDASVATFGPQTSQAALLEVETKPILAVPVHGNVYDEIKLKEEQEQGRESGKDEGASGGEDVKSDEEDYEDDFKLLPLLNAEELHGNVAVMTNTGGLSGVELAMVAQMSGAAAVLVVNVDEERPDDIYRLHIEHEDEISMAESIDIPVVMISFNSANVLTTATVTAETKQEDIVNNGMPERIRLYAGDDRPFFEDVEAMDPTIYLIHNLLTYEECDSLIQQAEPVLQPVTPKDPHDPLQLSENLDKFVNIERVMLWQGMLLSPARKAAEDRIEQVTGFPADHYSDFIVDRLGKGSHWKAHYDTASPTPDQFPIASITIFLSDDFDVDIDEQEGNEDEYIVDGIGGEVVYPSTAEGGPVMIQPRKGLAVVHHNVDDQHEFDVKSVHALLPVMEGDRPFYVARKFIFSAPVSQSRRSILPAVAALYGGRLPTFVADAYKYLIEEYGHEQGSEYFEKACVYAPGVIGALLLLIVGVIIYAISRCVGGAREPQQQQQQQQSSKSRRGNKPSSSSSVPSSSTVSSAVPISSKRTTKPSNLLKMHSLAEEKKEPDEAMALPPNGDHKKEQ